MIFRKSLVDKFGGYKEGDFPEDFELWLSWMELGIKIEKLPQVLLKWRDHPKKMSCTDSRYKEAAFQKIKAQYLNLWLKKKKIFCWGAGKVARKFAQILIYYGINLSGFIDPDTKKIGNQIAGLPIFPISSLSIPHNYFILILIGARGAREEVSAFLVSRGLTPGLDFLALS